MKFKSARQYYEYKTFDYDDVTPWDALPEETYKYWTKQWNLCRERQEKEVLDDSYD